MEKQKINVFLYANISWLFTVALGWGGGAKFVKSFN